MKFTKVQGAGNDFILVETSNESQDWSQTAITTCDRHFGIGADGLLLLMPSTVADFRMRIFNPDGSEAEACGNGLRCLIKYVVNRGMVNTGIQEISVETMSGVRKAKLHKAGGEVVRIQISMGAPKFGTGDIPIMIEPGKGKSLDIKSMLGYPVTVEDRELLLNLISMGNPHAVHFGQQPVSDFPLSQLGPKVQQLSIFPNGVNFEVARVMSRQLIEVRVWEKGVGETLACGSGACAVTVAAQLYGYIDNRVSIKLPGGMLDVEWDGVGVGVGEVLLTGPAEIVFTGEWPD